MTDTTKITMTKEVSLKRNEMIAEMKVEQERQDIKMLLSDEMKISSLPERFKRHLRHYKLINSTDELTSAGKRAKESGLIYEPEYGQYEIWWLKDNPGFEIKPLAIHRIRAGAGNNENKKDNGKWSASNPRDFRVDGTSEIVDADEKNTKVYMKEFDSRQIRRISEPTASGKLERTIEYNHSTGETRGKDHITAEKVFWTGKNTPDSKIDITENIEEDVPKLLKELFGFEYDESENWLNVKELPENPGMFTSSVHKKDMLHFDTIDVKNIPLHAAKEWVAKQWLDTLYHSEWKDHLVTKEEIEVSQKQWLESTVFQGYNVQPKLFTEVLKTLNDTNDMGAFWNIATMNDLRPSTMKCRIPFTIGNDEAGVEKTIHRHLFDGRHIRKIIISDRYVVEEKDKTDVAIIEKILSTINEIDKVDVTIYSRWELSNLPDKWKYVPLPKKRDEKIDDHGRRMLVKSDNNNWECWSFEHSFNSFKKELVSPLYNTETLKSTSSITVTPMFEIDKLPDYLKNAIGTDGGSKQ